MSEISGITRSELVSLLNKTMENLFTPLAIELRTLEAKVIELEFKVSAMRAHIPGMMRLAAHNFTVVSNDEAKKLHKGIVDRDSEYKTTTQDKHRCQCSECDPL